MSTSARSAIVIAIWVLTGGLRPAAALELPGERALPPNSRLTATASGTAKPGGLRRLPPVEVVRLPRLLPESPTVTVTQDAEKNRAPAESLEEAWRIALAVDQALQAKQWYTSSARFSEQSAKARRLPSLTMEGSYTGRSDAQTVRIRSGNPIRPVVVSPTTQSENAAFRWRMEMPLYTSGAIRHGIDAAGADVRSAQSEAVLAARDLKMLVANEYVAVLRAQRDLAVTETTARSLSSHADDVAQLYEYGQVPRNDLLAAQAALSNARQNVVRARHHLDTSRAAYNRYLARPLSAEVRLAELPVTPTDESLENLTSQALRARRELAQMTARIKALRHQAASIRSRNGLQVNLHGEYAFEENRYRVPEGIASLGVGASWNMFDGGRNRFQATSLQREAEGLVHARNDLERRITLEVRRAWLEIRETHQRRMLAAEAIERAEENIRVVRQRYNAGSAISTEVLDAEALRAQAYQNRDHANYDAVLADLRVRHATGRL